MVDEPSGLIPSGLVTSDSRLATAAKQLVATNNTFNMFFALSGL